MPFQDYSDTASANTQLEGPIFIGPNMARNDVRPALQQLAADGRELYDEIIARSGVSSPSFIQAGTGAVTRTLQAKAREIISVEDFGAVGDGVTNDTAAIAAAITRAIALGGAEIRFPAASYAVSKIDIEGATGCTFNACGFVTIIGIAASGSHSFIFGSNRARRVGDEVYTRRVRTVGYWSIGPAVGQVYTCGVALENFNECHFSGLYPNGEYGDATADRMSAYMDLSFNCTIEHCYFGYARSPGPGFWSYGLKMGPNNCNANIIRCNRFVGGGLAVARVAGLLLTGQNNFVHANDISVFDVGIRLDAAKGSVIGPNYGELVNTHHMADNGNSRGCIFMGGFHEIPTNGVAYDLSSSQDCTIIGGYYREAASATNCTFLSYGAACYNPTVISPTLVGIDNETVGTPLYDFAAVPSVPMMVPGGFKLPTTTTLTDVATGGGATAAANATAINAIHAVLRAQGLAA